MLEVHISHFMEALTEEKTKGPKEGAVLQTLEGLASSQE
jgi:hypothetical protein